MTKFHHQKRSGRRKKAKAREPRASLGIDHDLQRLLIHRELEALRRPKNLDRQKKLAEILRVVRRREQKVDPEEGATP
jgi:hypothetical protein